MHFTRLRALAFIQILSGIQPAPVVVEVVDNSDGRCDGGAKLDVLVVSQAFDKLPPLKRHRMVNACLKEGDDLMSQIHALSLRTYTIEQYESQKNS